MYFGVDFTDTSEVNNTAMLFEKEKILNPVDLIYI
jgi:hypothetical protein